MKRFIGYCVAIAVLLGIGYSLPHKYLLFCLFGGLFFCALEWAIADAIEKGIRQSQKDIDLQFVIAEGVAEGMRQWKEQE